MQKDNKIQDELIDIMNNINHQKLMYFIFLVSVLAVNLTPIEVYSLLTYVLIFLSLFLKGRIDWFFLRIVAPLFLFMFLGVVNSWGNEGRDVVRDLMYALFPISFLYIGNLLAKHKVPFQSLASMIIAVACLLAVIHLTGLIANPDGSAEGISGLTPAGYLTSDIVVIGLMLLLFRRRLGIAAFSLGSVKLNSLLAFTLLLLSLIFSFSRTQWMMFLFLMFPIIPIGRLTKILIILGSIVAIMVLVNFQGAFEIPEEVTFTQKILRSVAEVSISDYQNFHEISYNWRGFETFRAIMTWIEGGWGAIIAGKGFGALAELGFTMELAGSDFDAIPVLHNGYAYILLKTGLLGIACYCYFYISVWRYKPQPSLVVDVVLIENSFRIKTGIVLALASSMYVVGGIAEVHSAEFVILLGYLLRKKYDASVTPAIEGIHPRRLI